MIKRKIFCFVKYRQFLQDNYLFLKGVWIRLDTICTRSRGNEILKLCHKSSNINYTDTIC